MSYALRATRYALPAARRRYLLREPAAGNWQPETDSW